MCFGQGESKSHEDCSNGDHSHTVPSAGQHVGPRHHTWCHSGVSAGAQSEGSTSPPGSPHPGTIWITHRHTGLCAESQCPVSIGGFCAGPLLEPGQQVLLSSGHLAKTKGTFALCQPELAR